MRGIRDLDPIERIGQAPPAAVLLQFGRHDFFIAPMTGLEFRADRRAFLAQHLRLAEA